MTEPSAAATDRVSVADARETIRRLRTALTAAGVPDRDVREIVPASDLNGGAHVRMGTWDPASAAILADALTSRPPLIGRPDAPPLLPSGAPE